MSKRRNKQQDNDAKVELLKISHPMIWMFGIVAVTFQLMPLYFKGIEMPDNKISLLFTIPPLVAIIANQFWGYLADIHFDSKTVMIIMCIGSIFVMSIFPFFVTFGVLILLIAAMTFFSNARIPMLNALILDSKKNKERYGFIRSLGSLSFVVIGGAVAFLTDIFDLTLIFPVLIMLNILLVVSLVPLPGRHYHEKPKKRVSFWKVQKYLLKKPVIRIFMVFTIVTQMALVPSLMAQSLYIKDPQYVGGNNFYVSMALNIGAIAEISFFLCYDWLAKHVRLMPMFFVAMLAGPVRWIIVGSTTSISVIWVTCILHMATYGMMYMCSVMFINKELPPKLRNSGQTLLALAFTGISIVLGQFLAFVFLSFFPLRYWFYFAAALSLIPFPLWWKMSQLYCAEHKVSGILIRNQK